MSDEIMVSVVTLTYNHAPFISKTIESALSQKTNFRFEIIVHDDASTDGTADIVREYAAKYPDIIVPILQTENQYSKGANMLNSIPIRGKYIAYCEGDDYWCDDYKLQKQFDIMEQHTDYSLCLCNGMDMDLEGNLICERISTYESRVFSTEEILASVGNSFLSCGSFYRVSMSKSVTSEWRMGEVGDVPFRCFLALKGGVYCLADKMCCYRRAVPGSWTCRVERSKDQERRIRYAESCVKFYQFLKSQCGEKYQDVVNEKIERWQYMLALESADWKSMCKKEYRKYFNKTPAKIRVITFMQCYCPGLLKIYRMNKNRMNQNRAND